VRAAGHRSQAPRTSSKSRRVPRSARLAVAVGRVLQQRQLGRVAEDLIKRERRVAFGGDDDLGAKRRVLIGNVGVARQALVHEVPRQRPASQRLSARRQAQTIGVRERGGAEGLGEGWRKCALTTSVFAERSASSRRYHWVVQSIVSALMPVSSAIRVLPKLQAGARIAA